eukprot:CAMPEP_0117692304 /NCGR_PEP_ID=MMETSP0804-20121206/26251_1 /TAXON_ID=1074897 /ORGANISM="Tetraselmis astigmatica, Strain CCMP880" /LENGTH=32 /DNA_ID= /DNA_START= /DNA_END= /DNA_ORIENTATION=
MTTVAHSKAQAVSNDQFNDDSTVCTDTAAPGS